MERIRVVLDGTELRYQREWTPLVRRVVRGIARRRRGKWRSRWLLPIIAGGATFAGGTAAFQPTVVIHTTGSSATETFLGNAINVEVQAWAAGGIPGSGVGTACAARQGGGGGAGAYSRCTFSILTSPLKTLTYTVGTSGGNNTTVSSGTFAISTITCNSGVAGGSASGSSNGTGSAGGAATNANAGAINTTGASGTAGNSSGTGGQGGAGTGGNVSGDGSPYGAGGRGGFGASQAGQILAGGGAAVFYYT